MTIKLTNADEQLVQEFLMLDEDDPQYFAVLERIIARPEAEELLVRFDRATIAIDGSQNFSRTSNSTDCNLKKKTATALAVSLMTAVCLCIAVLCVWSGIDRDFDQVLTQIDAALERGDHIEARDSLSKLQTVALTAAQQGRFQTFESQVAAMTLIKDGEFAEVLKRFERATSSRLRMLVSLAKCRLPLESLAKLDGFGPLETYSRNSTIHVKNGEPKQGVFELTPPQQFSVALEELGECLHRTNVQDAAKQESRDATESCFELDRFAQLNLGIWLIHYGKYSEAIDVLQPAFESQPDSTAIAVAYAVAVFHHEEAERAIQILQSQLVQADVFLERHIEHLIEEMKRRTSERQ